MRKQIQILLISIILCTSSFYTNAQTVASIQDKRFSVDVGVEQNFMLTNWYGEKTDNKLVENAGITDIYARYHFRILKNWGAWLSTAYRIKNKTNRYESNRSILNKLDFNLSDYYISEQSYDSEEISRIKFSLGISYRFKLKKFDFMPTLGFGAHDQPYASFSYRLKQKNTNETYNVISQSGDYDSQLAYLNLYLKTSYRINKQSALTFGISFNQYLNRIPFLMEVKDYYNGTLISETKKKSRLINTLGISVGVAL